MAEKEQSSEEYQFTELDPLNPSAFDEKATDKAASTSADGNTLQSFMGEGQVKQKAFIAIGLFILISIMYKVISPYFEVKKLDSIEKTAPVETPAPPPPRPEPIIPKIQAAAPVPSEPVRMPNEMTAGFADKLKDLQSSNESINANVNSLSNQVSTVNSNMAELMKQISELTNNVATLTQKLESTTQEIAKRREIVHVRKMAPSRHHRMVIPYSKFYIQAVIPGRAWLVSTHGDTLTVRDGSSVPGYGRVTLIDPNQGRVLTSSGKTIRFSQQDS